MHAQNVGDGGEGDVDTYQKTVDDCVEGEIQSGRDGIGDGDDVLILELEVEENQIETKQGLEETYLDLPYSGGYQLQNV